jgi:hypothetical protein
MVATSGAPCTSVADEVIESRLSCLRQEVLNVNFVTGCPVKSQGRQKRKSLVEPCPPALIFASL